MMQTRKIIFTDIDGTLNNNAWRKNSASPWIMRSCVKHLNAIALETDAHLVITSQRRLALHTGRISISGFQMLLKSHGMTAPLAGYLPWVDDRITKQVLIQDWLTINPWQQYVILDDTLMHLNNLITTVSTVGLTAENAITAIAILRSSKINDVIVQSAVNDTIEIL